MQDNEHWNGWRVIGRGAHRICVGPVGPEDECLKFVVSAGVAMPPSRWLPAWRDQELARRFARRRARLDAAFSLPPS